VEEGATGLGVTDEEGIQALRRILARPAAHVVVATGELKERAERWVGTAGEARAPRPAAARPRTRTPYAEPRDEIEERICAIWQDLLGLEQVGIHDSFLELGGHSLLGIQVLSKLRGELRVELPVDTLYRASTVAELAALVMDRLIAEIDGLSDEEALQLAGSESDSS
jgi:acyl carrier protein